MSCLDEGLSLRAIGERFGLDPSTVGYWVRRHGLVANGRGKHAPKGGIDGPSLAIAVDAGLTQRELADEFDCSLSTISYWLRRHGLKTARAHKPMVITESGEAIGVCRTHGTTAFVRENRGYFRCKACRKQRVIEWRRRAKARLVAEAGGCCRICGYDRYPGALHFHHLDPSSKEFGLAQRGLTKSLARLKVEASKCVLLCSNCHAEVEAGVSELPPPALAPVSTPNS